MRTKVLEQRKMKRAKMRAYDPVDVLYDDHAPHIDPQANRPLYLINTEDSADVGGGGAAADGGGGAAAEGAAGEDAAGEDAAAKGAAGEGAAGEGAAAEDGGSGAGTGQGKVKGTRTEFKTAKHAAHALGMSVADVKMVCDAADEGVTVTGNDGLVYHGQCLDIRETNLLEAHG